MSELDPPTSIDHAFDAAEEMYARIGETVHNINMRFKIEERWEGAKLFLHEHPISTLFLVVLFALCALPLFCFTAFAFGSLTVMFISFVFVEGLLLSVGLFCLVGVLSFLTCIAVGVSIFVAGAGYLFIIAHKVASAIYAVLTPRALQENRGRKISPLEDLGYQPEELKRLQQQYQQRYQQQQQQLNNRHQQHNQEQNNRQHNNQQQHESNNQQQHNNHIQQNNHEDQEQNNHQQKKNHSD